MGDGRLDHFLIVDDDPHDAEILREALHEVLPGCRVHWVQTGAQALDHLSGSIASGDLPAVILDLHLVGEYGADLLESWRAQTGLRHLYVAVLTSSDLERDVRNARAADATAYYLKPATWPEYLHLVSGLATFFGIRAPDQEGRLTST